MAGFIFRARRVFTLDEMSSLEGVYVEDLDPSAPIDGIGTGVTCLIGEFDDGPLEALTVLEGGDITRQFGTLGYNYAGVPSNNPCARRRNGELWNGNGFLYSKFIRSPRFLVVRVDSSVGEVSMSPLAVIQGERGPFPLSVGDLVTLTSSTGGPTPSDAIAAGPGTHTGSGAIVATGFAGGEQISLTIDGGAPIIVTFAASDQLAPAVIARINAAVGANVASEAAGTVTVDGIIQGTGGSLVLADVTPGALAALLLTAGTYNGTGNVANLQVVTAAEVAAIINGTAALGAIDVAALVGTDGRLSIYDTNSGSGTILAAASAMATAIGLDPIGTTVAAGVHNGGTIPAGTRVRNVGGDEWVTMVSTTVAAGDAATPNPGPHVLKVRPAFDDGTAAGATSGTVTTLVDQPSFAVMAVTNPADLTAALTEPQLDVRYQQAFDRTVDQSDQNAIDITFMYCARRSYALDVYIVAGNEDASNNGFAGRKYTRSGALGITLSQAEADVAQLRSDRVFYTWPGWQVAIPEIQVRGAAGGVGFTDSGVITLRAAGTLTKINALLPPEENPGQATNLLTNFFAVENLGFGLTANDYRALKAAGICAPRVDRVSGSIFQSGVTSSLISGRTTQARRKMADFIQDSIARAMVPFSKKLATDGRKDSIVGKTDDFFSTLLSESDPEAQRIASYSLDLSGNSDATEARGIFVIINKTRTLSSLDAIEFRTEIGEGVVTVNET